MKNLSLEEKRDHHSDLEKYVKKINHFYLKSKSILDKEGEEIESLFNLFNVKLVQVGYGVLVGKSYFYFDYPYEQSVEKFNKDLAEHEKIGRIDVDIHKKFHTHNQNKENGYIYYSYDLDKENGNYISYCFERNIDISKKEYLMFLPIMDCAVTNENTYLYPVEESIKTKTGSKELLILSKKLGLNNKYSYDDNTLVCAFKLNMVNADKLSELTANLYNEVFFSLEKYFHSPVLNKLISEKRKSYILGYQHNLGNLHLKSEVQMLSLLKKNILSNYSLILDSTIDKLKTIDLTHTFLFDYEYLNAGFDKYSFTFKDLTIETIFKKHFFYTKPEYEDFTDLKNNSNYIPILIDKFGNYIMTDLAIILWNLWTNACKVSIQCKEKIELNIQEDEEHVNIEIINNQKMPDEIIKYIDGNENKHPYEENSRPIRGWTIIKDIVQNNSSLELEYDFSTNTNIKIKITK